MQAASLYMFRRIYTLTSFPILIISTITGTIVYSDSRVTKYAISALSLMMAILSSLQRQIRPSERAQEHSLFVQKYNVIIRSINTTLSLPDDQRPCPNLFIQQVKEQLDSLANTQPEPPEFIIYYFNRRFRVSVEKALYGDSLHELLARDPLIMPTEERPSAGRFIGLRNRFSSAYIMSLLKPRESFQRPSKVIPE